MKSGLRILFIAKDAYGGHGGIAQYSRDMAEALCEIPEVGEVVILPRVKRMSTGLLPSKVTFKQEALGGKWHYFRAAVKSFRGGYDLVVCGHIRLLPMAVFAKWRLRAPMVLMVYGTDVWKPWDRLSKRLISKVDLVWSISRLTWERMKEWSHLPDHRMVLIPNTVKLSRYGMKPKNEALVSKYQLDGRRVLMTLARLPLNVRIKGIDEVLEVLPELVKDMPDLLYMVLGHGQDRFRLEAKAEALGVKDHVLFTGYIEEELKADYLRLADAFVMPSRNEGFGFVFLEALACGVPAVASVLDGGREALRNGQLGELVDPGDPESVKKGITAALERAKGVPPGLSYFSWPVFSGLVKTAVGRAVGTMSENECLSDVVEIDS
ncbi:MAG: glycosyltransferase family 4 protein [Acidobacteriota bacterium]|jgi:phosphatidyl-myo-inositol dimannoside synthase